MIDFPIEGWMVLHRLASNLSSVDFDEESDDYQCVDLSQWVGFVFDIPRKLGLNWGSEKFPYRTNDLGKLILSKLVENLDKDRKKTTDKTDRTSAWNLYINLKLPKGMSETLCLIRDTKYPMKVKFDQKNPVSIFRAGVNEINSIQGPDEQSCTYRLVRGLALIGIGYRKWKSKALCEYCFRTPLEGKSYCNEHTNDHGKTLKNKNTFNQDVKHKVGKITATKMRATNDVRWKEYRNNIYLNHDSIVKDTLFPLDITDDWSFESQKKCLLDTHAINQNKFELALLTYSIDRSTCVKRLFKNVQYTNLNANDLIEQCRTILDPLDYSNRLSHWAYKIDAAELWLALETSTASTPRGPNQVSPEKLQNAISLFKNGYRKAEIAEELGISRSTLSNWIKRYNDLQDVFKNSSL